MPRKPLDASPLNDRRPTEAGLFVINAEGLRDLVRDRCRPPAAALVRSTKAVQAGRSFAVVGGPPGGSDEWKPQAGVGRETARSDQDRSICFVYMHGTCRIRMRSMFSGDPSFAGLDMMSAGAPAAVKEIGRSPTVKKFPLQRKIAAKHTQNGWHFGAKKDRRSGLLCCF